MTRLSESLDTPNAWTIYLTFAGAALAALACLLLFGCGGIAPPSNVPPSFDCREAA